MKSDRSVPDSVDAYIAGFPPDVRAILRKMRATIRKAAPGAEERISWGVPAYALDGMLTFFAAFEKHVSIFPGPSGIEKFRKELAAYETSKGTVRFPLGKPIPYGLIARIVKFRVKENRVRAESRLKNKSGFRLKIEQSYAEYMRLGGIGSGELIRKLEKGHARKAAYVRLGHDFY